MSESFRRFSQTSPLKVKIYLSERILKLRRKEGHLKIKSRTSINLNVRKSFKESKTSRYIEVITQSLDILNLH